MEGALFKWEGYLTGWSLHYFVLQNGSLSHYQTKENFNNADPAIDTINMGLCEIIVDRNTLLQFELKIAADSKILYLKTEKPEERATWIRALGSAKACLLGSLTQGLIPDEPINENHLVPNGHSDLPEPSEDQISDEESSSESDNYNSAQEEEDKNATHSGNTDNEQSLNSSGLPKLDAEFMSKCDRVKKNISTLQQDMQTNNSSLTNEGFYNSLDTVDDSLQDLLGVVQALKSNAMLHITQPEKNITNSVEKQSDINASENITDLLRNTATFFKTRSTTFANVNEQTVYNQGEGLIPVTTLLEACICYHDFFDRFGGTVLSPLKSDLVGNINKIRKVVETDPDKLIYLQDLISYELRLNQNTGPDTATQALLWMTRGLRVMGNFIHYLLSDDSSTKKVTATSFVESYSKFLAKHHNWMVQRLFKVGMKMLPTYDAFVECMTEKEDWEKMESEKEIIYEKVHNDGLRYGDSMIELTENICKLFKPLNMEV